MDGWVFRPLAYEDLELFQMWVHQDHVSIGRGLGPEMIRAFLHDVVFVEASDAAYCWIDPDPPNRRAVRAYEKAGFEPVARVERVVEGKLEEALLMRLERSAHA